jgi:hypothetical protein
MPTVDNIAVIGLPRCGTSLVWDVLAHHPDVQAALYEPLRAQVLVPNAHQALWNATPRHAEAVRSFYTPAFEYHPITLPHEGMASALGRYLDAVLFQPGTVAKFISLTLRAGWFARRYPDTKIVWVVRSPFAFCQSMKPNPSTWTDPGLADWLSRTMDAGIGTQATFDDFHAIRAHHDYAQMLHLWGWHVAHMLAVRDEIARDFVTVKLEDFTAAPYDEVGHVFGVSGNGLPLSIQERISGTAVERRDSPLNFERKVDAREQLRPLPYPEDAWDRHVAEAGVGKLIQQMGYLCAD